MNAVTLAILAIAGAANGVDTDGGVAAWRFPAYVLVAVLAYLHGRRLRTRYDTRILWVVAVACTPLIGIEFWEAGSAWLSLLLSMVLPWQFGRYRLQREDLLAAERERVARLEREQEFVVEQARLRERARIATDMHDSLGHELALIAVRAGALELAADMTDANRSAAGRLRAGAVEATDRLRATIGMLRDADPTPVEPPDDPVADLVVRAESAGMRVRLVSDAIPDVLPPLVDRAVHRVVQEALTNAARYAPGAIVTVRIECGGEELTVSVRNGAAAGAGSAAPTASGPGHGLAGLAERARLAGGEFRAGPSGDGFEVVARLPMGAT